MRKRDFKDLISKRNQSCLVCKSICICKKCQKAGIEEDLEKIQKLLRDANHKSNEQSIENTISQESCESPTNYVTPVNIIDNEVKTAQSLQDDLLNFEPDEAKLNIELPIIHSTTSSQEKGKMKESVNKNSFRSNDQWIGGTKDHDFSKIFIPLPSLKHQDFSFGRMTPETIALPNTIINDLPYLVDHIAHKNNNEFGLAVALNIENNLSNH